MIRRVAIVSPVRTPVGKFGGVLRSLPAESLASTVIDGLIQRTGIDPSSIDDVVFGHAYPSGETPRSVGTLP